MKNQVTRAELEAIGENWFQRRNKLLKFAHNESKPTLKRSKAFGLAVIMNLRCARVANALMTQGPKMQFPPGGVSMSFPSDNPEFVIPCIKKTPLD